jgi:hypothetical protein
MNKQDAEEYTRSLSQIFAGSWQQIAWAQGQKIPQALGLTTEQWVKERLGGYVRMAIADRREAVLVLTAEGMSTRQVGEVLGVTHTTVENDLGGKNLPKPPSKEPKTGKKLPDKQEPPPASNGADKSLTEEQIKERIEKAKNEALIKAKEEHDKKHVEEVDKIKKSYDDKIKKLTDTLSQSPTPEQLKTVQDKVEALEIERRNNIEKIELLRHGINPIKSNPRHIPNRGVSEDFPKQIEKLVHKISKLIMDQEWHKQVDDLTSIKDLINLNGDLIVYEQLLNVLRTLEEQCVKWRVRLTPTSDEWQNRIGDTSKEDRRL